MRRVVLLAVAVVLLVPGSADARSRGCGIPRSRVVAGNAHVVVVRHLRDYFACTRPHGPRRSLRTYGKITGHFQLSGRFVAYERDDDCWAGCRRIVSLDVRTGRTLVSYGAFELTPLRKLVVDARGRVAWIRDAGVRELRRMDSDGEDVLDTGPGIEPASLGITADKVAWRNDGEAKEARLDSHPPCAARNTSSLKRTPEVRIFWKALPPSRDDTFGIVYGCALATGRVTQMGSQGLDTFEYTGGGYVEAAGHFATIDEGFSGRSGANVDFSVFDLTTGRRVHRWRCCQEADFRLEALVLHPTGAVAWIYDGGFWGSDKETVAVAKSDSTGEAVVLASADRPDPARQDTLRLDANVVSWTLNGVPGSAELR